MAQVPLNEFENIGRTGYSVNNSHNNGLLASTSRVEAPFVRVEIGGYTFGVYEQAGTAMGANGLYKNREEKYPNYVKSIEIKKINGTVNQYTINLEYPVTEYNDPNFFERIFSSVSNTRILRVSYGDFSLPNYIYQNIDGTGEEAIITDVQTSFDMRSSVISYTISATSTATLTLSGCYNFGGKTMKPSEEIFNILYDSRYNLLDVFTGMKDRAKVEQDGLIAQSDKMVYVPTYTNISALEYISKLVEYMTPTSTTDTSMIKTGVYTLTTYEDTSGVYGGPYFKVSNIETAVNTLNKLCTYTVDIGYPTANIVTSFRLKNSSNWSIYYNYNKSIKSSDYIKRINADGDIEYEFSPLITGADLEIDEADKSWWTKVTEFPIQAELTIKGLLKPAILMTYIKLNLWFFGHKHTASGYYIITSQVDRVDGSGYVTTLGLTRVAADEELV